jgi:hypothetical protein
MRSPPEFAVLERAKRASHVDPAASSYAIIRLEVTEFFGQPIRFQLINVKEYPDKKAIKRLLTNGRLRSLTKARRAISHIAEDGTANLLLITSTM